MFGLPTATVVIIFGIPAIWVIYTIVFVYLSRRWKAEDVAEDKLTAGGSGPATSAPGHRSEPENGGVA